jgi:hypothetical protein
MRSKLALALLSSTVLLAAAGCGSATANPIGSGGSSSSSTSGTTGSTGTAASGGSGGSGGSAEGAPCDPACGSGEVCVASACHALVKLDTSDEVNADGCKIVTDTANVYWMTGEVRRISKSGGTAAILDSGTTAPGGLVVDDTYLYWTDLGIMRVEKDAPPVPGTTAGSQFADEGGLPTQMVGDGTTLYYLDSSTLDQVSTSAPPDPQAPPTAFSGTWSGGSNAPIAVDATSVYFWSEGASVLTQMDKTTQQMKTIGYRDNGVVGDACSIVSDGGTVYYSTAPTPGAGGFIAASAGAPPAGYLVDPSVGATGVFTVDAYSIYFTTAAEVMMAPKAGGAPVTVSSLKLPTPFPSCMAADDTYVYWVDGLDLMRYTK